MKLAVICAFLLAFVFVSTAAQQAGCVQGAAVPNAAFSAFHSQLLSLSTDSSRQALVVKFCANLTRGFSGNQTVAILSAFSFSSTMVEVSKLMSRYILGIDCADAAQILHTFSFSTDKLTVLAGIANTIIDPQNNITIINEFGFTSDKDRAREILAKMVPRSCVFGSVVEKRVQFVVDVSGSMSTPFVSDGVRVSRLSFVGSQLNTVIGKQLTSDQQFNVFSFSNFVNGWKPGLVPVNSTNQQSAITFVNSLRSDGATNIYGALERAFQDPNVVAIYLLTDGVPSYGVTNIDQILAAAQKWSKSRNPPVVINTISFLVGNGPESPSEMAKSKQMMEAMALSTGGVFRALA